MTTAATTGAAAVRNRSLMAILVVATLSFLDRQIVGILAEPGGPLSA